MSRNPTSRKTQDHHRHRRGELIAGSAGDLHMKTIERTASAQSASRRKPLTVDEDQRLEKQERCRNPLSTLWLEDQECYQALEWVLRQVPHSESEVGRSIYMMHFLDTTCSVDSWIQTGRSRVSMGDHGNASGHLSAKHGNPWLPDGRARTHGLWVMCSEDFEPANSGWSW